MLLMKVLTLVLALHVATALVFEAVMHFFLLSYPQVVCGVIYTTLLPSFTL